MNIPVFTPVEYLGRWTINSVRSLGKAGYLATGAVRALRNVEIWGPRLMTQMVSVGVASVPIALFIAMFTGIVLALQASYTLTGVVPMYLVGTLVGKSMILELGPVLTGLSLAGRVGASTAAEVGTMRVTEQIDALETLESGDHRRNVTRIVGCDHDALQIARRLGREAMGRLSQKVQVLVAVEVAAVERVAFGSEPMPGTGLADLLCVGWPQRIETRWDDFDGPASMLGEDVFCVFAKRDDAIDALGDEAIDSLAELAERTLPGTPSVGREFIVQNRVRDVDHRGAGDGSTGEADDRCFGIVGQHDVERTLSMSADKARE